MDNDDDTTIEIILEQEQVRRQIAHDHRGEVVEGSGEPIDPWDPQIRGGVKSELEDDDGDDDLDQYRSPDLILRIEAAEEERDHHARMTAQYLVIGRLDLAMNEARRYRTAEEGVVRLYREMEGTM